MRGRAPAAAVATLLSLAACRNASDFPPCRDRGATVRMQASATSAATPSAEDAVTIAAMPGWHTWAAKYGRDFDEQAGPIIKAVEDRVLGHFKPGENGHLEGVYRALGKLLTLDPKLGAEGLDTSAPLVLKLRPARRHDPSVFLKLTVVPGRDLPRPDLFAQGIVRATDPPRLLGHLQQVLAKKASCLAAPAGAGANSQVCMLKKHGLVVFTESEKLIHIGLLSGDFKDSRQDLVSSYLEAMREGPILGLSDIQSAAADRARDRAALWLTIPGRMVTPLTVNHELARAWSFVVLAAEGGAGIAVDADLAMEGYLMLGEYALALPWRLEVRSTRLALVMQESVRITLDIDLTDHGARLLDLGLRAMVAPGIRGHHAPFDLDRILSSVEPVESLYVYEGDYGGMLSGAATNGIGTARFLLEAPAAGWKTMTSSMEPEHRSPGYIARIVANGLGVQGMSWDISGGADGTLIEAAGAPDEQDPKRNPALRFRAWVVSSRALRLEACLLPALLPCGPSTCSDELVVDDSPSVEPAVGNPCWEQALSDLRAIVGNLAWMHSPRFEGPRWFRQVMPLHASLMCASHDTRYRDDAAEIDRALLHYIERRGSLRRVRAEPKLFFRPGVDESD
jgi:hypothetical protein